MTESTSTIPYRPDIDALRAVAVGLVILHHAFPRIAPAGFVGVDVFFVISGYLITGIVIKQRVRNAFTLRGFYDRRIRRIFPAAVVVLFTALLLGWLVLFAPELKQLGRHILSSATFTENLRLRNEIGYFDEAANLKPLLHFWSLSIEEQFYLVWPLLLGPLLLMRGRLPGAIGGLAALSLGYAYWQTTRQPEAVYYDTFGRVWQLAAGAVLFAATRGAPRHLSAALHRTLSALAALAIGVAGFAPIAGPSFPSVNALAAVAGAVLWLYAAPMYPGTSLAAGIGKISYSLYLWHWLFLSFGRIYTGGPLSTAATILLLSVTIVVSVLSYRFVESWRYSQWRGTSPTLAGAMILCALSGFAVVKTDGLPERSHLSYLSEYALQLKRTPHEDTYCRTYVRSQLGADGLFYYCRASSDVSDPSRPKVALIGDSHAHVLFPGIADEAARRGYSTILLANSSCPPLPGFMWGNTAERRETCQQSIEQIFRMLQQDPAIRIVLLTTRGPVYIHGEPEVPFRRETIDRGLKHYDDSEFMRWPAFAEALSTAVQRLTSINHIHTVAYLLENPELDFLPKDLPPRPFDRWGLSLRQSWVSRPLYERRMHKYRNLVAETKQHFPDLLVLDPTEVLCDAEKCYAFRDGQFLYADDDHFSVHGSRVIARALAPVLFGQDAANRASTGANQ